MRWALLILLLTIPTLAQAPPDNLERAMQTLHTEIQNMREEVKALKERQANEAKAQELRAARRPAPRRVKEARRQKPTPKDNPLVIHIKTREEQIQQNQMILAQLTATSPPLVTEAQRKAIVDLVIQRNDLREKVRRANNRRACRWFRIGCIGKK